MDENIASSFRDPSGFVFKRDGVVLRQVNRAYQEDYDSLMSSGLYTELTKSGLLIPHEELEADAAQPSLCYKIIKPRQIPFISYPYEWPFSALKHAALATLSIQRKAMDKGLVLKDASAYNIQFVNARPVFIDTLSFESYNEGEPWVAYRQFCQHFFAPLMLMSKSDVRLNQLSRVFIDGIPLDLASGLLPARSRLNVATMMHIHMNSKMQARHADAAGEDAKPTSTSARELTRQGLIGIVESLQSAIKKLRWEPKGTEWGDYYENTNYTDDAAKNKQAIIESYIDAAKPADLWDLGGNTGVFSRIASHRGIPTVCFDIDPAAVEKNYLCCVENNEENLLPLVLDLTNPSPGMGWSNAERETVAARGPADMAMALALIHHLAISNNVPLHEVAAFFARLCNSLIIEFVPKSDSQVKRLLATRKDIFPNYTQEGFEQAFSTSFSIEKAEEVTGSERTLYLMRTR